MEATEKALKALEWYEKMKKYFAPFKPDTTHVSLNYREKTCEIRLHIEVPQGLRRRIGKIEIPAFQEFRIKEIMDQAFCKVYSAFHFENGVWKLNADQLPASEHYLVYLEGKMDAETVDKIVRVQPAINRDQTEEFDRYWLGSMIRDVQLLEKIWQYLEVEDVDVLVKISVDRCFSAVMPPELKEKIEATQKFLEAGKTRDRERLYRAWSVYRQVLKKSTISIDNIVEVARKLTEPDAFSTYLSVDPPYRIGQVFSNEIRRPFPELINVNARTDLSFKCPAAIGYLTLKRRGI